MNLNNVIIATATRYLMPLLLLLSVFILERGHNEPGGGFIGGLVAAAAFSLYTIAYDSEETRRTLRVNTRRLMAFGLLLSVSSGIIPLLLGSAFLEGLWTNVEVPVLGKLGTPLLFDIGVYFVVIGVSLTIILPLAEIVEARPARAERATQAEWEERA